MIVFGEWRERVERADREIPVRVRYTRKSSESEDKQVASHEQQWEELEDEFGPVDPIWWWRDSKTGRNFDREAFQDLLAFCRANRRPRSNPGRIEMYAPSRFGRLVDEESGDPI